ncbi:hypothetical protein QL285_068048 [Trifolium repens]|nr:hypothetical protein QL285_068048 [Trifolium repens]
MEYHDHGYPMIGAVSPSSSVSHVVMMGGYAPVSVVLIGVVVPEARAPSMWRVASALLSRQSTAPQARGEVVIVLVAMIVVIMVGNRPLLSFVRIAISL